MLLKSIDLSKFYTIFELDYLLICINNRQSIDICVFGCYRLFRLKNDNRLYRQTTPEKIFKKFNYFPKYSQFYFKQLANSPTHDSKFVPGLHYLNLPNNTFAQRNVFRGFFRIQIKIGWTDMIVQPLTISPPYFLWKWAKTFYHLKLSTTNLYNYELAHFKNVPGH